MVLLKLHFSLYAGHLNNVWQGLSEFLSDVPSLPSRSWQEKKIRQEMVNEGGKGGKKSCLVRKEKDHETGDTEEETFFFSSPSAAVSKQAEKVKEASKAKCFY